MSMLDPDQPTDSLPLIVPEAPPEREDDELETLEGAVIVEDLPGKPRLLRRFRADGPSGPRGPRGPVRLTLHRVRILAAGLIGILLLVLIGFAIQSRIPVVQYAQAKTGTLTVQFNTTGTLQSASYAADFAGSGQIAEIDVTVGQPVSAGAPLAKLNTTQLQDAVNQANAAVTSAQTKVNDAQDNLAKVQAATAAAVQQAYDTEQKVLAGCGSDSGCIQRAQDAYATAQAQADQQNSAAQLLVDDAQTTLSDAQAALQTAQDNLSGATLIAPHAGTVSAINQAVGSTVVGSNATAPVTNFIVIQDLSALQIAATVPVSQVTGVQNGVQNGTTHARFTVPAAGSAQFNAQVNGVSPNGTLVNNVLTYPLTITVDMPSVQASGANLYPGMTANVTVIIVEKPGVTLIPASAVAFAQAAGNPKEGGFLTSKQVATVMQQARDMVVQTDDAGNVNSADPPQPSYVLQNTNGKWVPVPVLLGLTNGTSYEVLGGLAPGEKIVTGETNSSVAVPTPTPVISQ